MKNFLTLLISCLVLNSFAQTKDELFIRDSAKLSAELKQMTKDDQQHRKRKEIALTDDKNTQRMIAIINTYGYPSKGRLGFSGNAGVILIHAPGKYTDTLQRLIDKEKAAQRLSINMYEYIKWHINGRYRVPAFDSASGIKMKDKRKHKQAKVLVGTVQIDSFKK